MQIRRIVVATDFSEVGERAASEAFELAETHDAQVFLVHAVDLGGLVTVGPGGIEPYVDLVTISRGIRRDAEQQLEDVVKKLKCPVTVRPEVHLGSPVDVVLEVAERTNADLIVCGTHGRSGLRRLLFGSVAEKIVRSSTRPVLLIPPAADSPSVPSVAEDTAATRHANRAPDEEIAAEPTDTAPETPETPERLTGDRQTTS